jgi:predicted PurR-regulated permease PerM
MNSFNRLLKKKWFANTVATCSAVLLFMILSHLSDIFEGLDAVFSFLRPIINGIIIAYVINPLCHFMERKLFHKIKNEKTKWMLSVVVSLIIIVLCIILLFVALIPQLADSISTLASNMDTYIDALQDLLHGFETGSKGFFGLDIAALANVGDTVLEKVSGYFTNNMGNFLESSANVGKGVVDVVLALILAIYFLLDKARIVGDVDKLMSLIMKRENYEKTTEFLTRCNNILIRYIAVDVVDGIVVGLLNFLFMVIMRMPYAALISVIVGVTNLAPTFGPLVGAVLGGFILVLLNPWYALWFLIFTAILQTLDGYIIKPKLFGGSLGVSSLMILIAIILGGRLFGVGGILIAIPFAAIIDFAWQDFVIKKLEERQAKRYNN